jgi:hypothetical protein
MYTIKITLYLKSSSPNVNYSKYPVFGHFPENFGLIEYMKEFLDTVPICPD